MPWYFYKKNGSQKLEDRDAELSGIVKMYTGGVSLTAGTSAEAMTAPPNYLYCNGAAVSIASFTDLYNAFGGTDKFRQGKTSISGSFYLPDYRDKFPVGTSSTKSMSTTSGSNSVSFLLPSHFHSMPHTHNIAQHTHSNAHTHGISAHDHYIDHTHFSNIPAPGVTDDTGTGNTVLSVAGTNPGAVVVAQHPHTHGVGAQTVNTSGMGAGGPYGNGRSESVPLTTLGPTPSSTGNVDGGSLTTGQPSNANTGAPTDLVTTFVVVPPGVDGTKNNLPPYQPLNFMVRI